MTTSQVLTLPLVAASFLWLGLITGISFVEAPLKFRFPGITLALGVGIGRLVFRALNAIEAVLAVVLTRWPRPDRQLVQVAKLTVILILLALRASVVRPLLDGRAQRLFQGESQPPSPSLHIAYIGMEIGKAFLLPAFATLVLLRMIS